MDTRRFINLNVKIRYGVARALVGDFFFGDVKRERYEYRNSMKISLKNGEQNRSWIVNTDAYK